MIRDVSLGSMAGVCSAMLLLLASPSSAQTPAGSALKGFVSINAGTMLPAADSLTDLAFQTDGLNRDEVRAEYPIKSARALDLGGGVILRSGLMMGVAVSHAAAKEAASLSMTLTHPNFHPTLNASLKTDALNHTETGVHMEFGYAFPTFHKVDVMVFGGPSHFNVSQALIIDFFGDETFNAATRTFSAVVSDPVTERKSASSWGYNAGADVSLRINRVLGIGTLIRYSRATASIDDPFQSALRDRDATQDLKIGGLQATAGVRLRF